MRKGMNLIALLCMCVCLLLPMTVLAQDNQPTETLTTPEGEPAVTVLNGWHKDADGRSRYYVNGAKKTGFQKIGSKYYYLSNDGVPQTGLRTVNGKTYYFMTTGGAGTLGTSVSGWVTYNKYCYFFDKKTFVAKKSTIYDDYKLDKYGRSKTRYLVINIVNKKTNSKMSKDKKIKVLWNYVVKSSWTYTRTYEHMSKKWKWKTGWQDDFAKDLLSKRTGNCFRYAAAFGYLVHEATGYQVRVYHGMTPATRGGLTPHGWITVKIGKKWYAYDPDLYKFSSHSSSYYKKLYSSTKKRIHRKGKYVTL